MPRSKLHIATWLVPLLVACLTFAPFQALRAQPPTIAPADAEAFRRQVRTSVEKFWRLHELGAWEWVPGAIGPDMETSEVCILYRFEDAEVSHCSSYPWDPDGEEGPAGLEMFNTAFVFRALNVRGDEVAKLIIALMIDAELTWVTNPDTGELEPHFIHPGRVTGATDFPEGDELPLYWYIGASEGGVTQWANLVPVGYAEGPDVNPSPTLFNPIEGAEIEWTVGRTGISEGDLDQVVIADQGLAEYDLILVLVAIVVIAILILVGPAVGDVFCMTVDSLASYDEEPGTCGDGNPDPGEECDDGNQESCDGCSQFCSREPYAD